MGKLTVVLDPGHYTGYNKGVAPGYNEGDKMWILSGYLKQCLEELGITTIITRPATNVDMDLYARGQVAVKNKADVFISMHTNAIGDTTRWEKAYGVVAYRSLFLPGSADLGTKLVDAVVGVMKASTGVTYSRGVNVLQGSSGADYYGVIRGAVSGAKSQQAAAAGPVKHAFIIEHGFHTHSKECAFVNDVNNLMKIAKAEAEVIAKHFGITGTIAAPTPSVTAPTAPIVVQPANKPSPSPVTLTGGSEKDIWDFCIRMGMTAVGAAGICAQARAESGYNSCNLQNSYEWKLGYTDSGYVAAVDSGKYTNFVKDAAGFGLFQWTYWSRKEFLLNMAKQRKASIGDFATQLECMWAEINSKYKGLLPFLKGNDLVATTNELTMKYEGPAASTSPDPAVKAKCLNDRVAYAQEAYAKYAGLPVAPVAPQTPPKPETVTETAGLAATPVPVEKAENGVIGTIRVIYEGADGLNVHTTPEWGNHNINTACGPVKKGIYRVTENVKVGGSTMYKLFSGVGYITGDENYVTFTPAIPAAPAQKKEITVGSVVTVLKPVTYTGGTFKLYHKNYDVISISGNRVVIGKGKTVTCAINKDNLQLV